MSDLTSEELRELKEAFAAVATPGRLPWEFRGRPDLFAAEGYWVALLDSTAEAKAICRLVNAAAQLIEMARRAHRYSDALATISGIRDSIIATQSINWSEHIYPLVAALDSAGFPGVPYEQTRATEDALDSCDCDDCERDAELEEQLFVEKGPGF